MRDAAVRKRDCRSSAGARNHGKDTWHFGETLAATLYQAKIRSLVCRESRRDASSRFRQDKRRGAASTFTRRSHSLGRYVCALSRTPHWNCRSESSRSARLRSLTREEPEMLRATGIQPGQPRCGSEARKTQCRSFEFCRLSTINSQLSTIGTADFVPRALLLVDVRGRLP